ncbi:uncharacterized protein [Parasteatoda tepidariorum]|uniref:uncharacterized protein isoform X2 n=1 Tax=Parasteatoda tepidariorum TaxID=114398 RepID=UPI001C724970|nr:RNA-dependent RNA polymerase 1 isoform X2 [Parasteatoda tepidariorum]
MEYLEFKIVVIPRYEISTEEENEYYLTKFKKHLLKCQLKHVSLKVLKIERADNEDYVEIEELVLQARASIDRNGQKHRSYYYNKFCKNWKQLFFPKPTPLLLLHANNSFKNNFETSHLSVSMENMAFGVLPFNGEFHQFASLRKSYVANFLHDERKVVLFYGEYQITFTYANIRNIFFNIETSDVFFDLGNPPLIFLLEKRKTNRGNDSFVECLTHIIKCSSDSDDIDFDIIGRSNVLRLRFSLSKEKEEIVSRIHFRCSAKPIYYGHIISIKKEKPQELHVEWNNFGCTYLLTAIFRRNFTMASQTSDVRKSLHRLYRISLKNGIYLERALTLALAALDTGKVVNFWLAIEKMFAFYLDNKIEIHYIVPEKCRLIRRITITPTRHMLWPPEIMMGNRILRKFDSEYSLRVSFRDDNHSRLSFHVPYAFESVFDHAVRYPMTTGIDIGSRHFEFLAWSNSQIRDHGVWMYAEDSDGNTANTIRDWMGNFSHIRTVSKYMARIGQCFSQTEDAVSVPFDSLFVRTEPDIEGGFDPENRKAYCFSDGIGKISSEMTSKVHEGLGHDKHCSAFQIRYGGYKGMLVTDPTLEDTDIVFRNSMKKFDSPDSIKLEIARTSAPTTLQLNRPLITILNDLGVRHRTFLKLQEDMLRNLTDMLIDEEKSWEYLTMNTSTHLFNFKTISESGIHLTTEPFFRSLLLALHRNHVDKIKTKANLQIDSNLGRNMLGVLDEVGLLKEGQVFVQYTKDVTRGETTKDTIIKTGGDLDGDEYCVFWDEDLIFHRDNYTPGHFRNASSETNNAIMVEDMIDFLVQFIKNDQVGSIASAHLAQADQESIFSEKCITIAKKFSYAVDFAKTGVSTHLHGNERPTKFPDFMERHFQESYKSKKALGKMYRVIRDYESENEEASLAYSDVKMDKDLVYPGWENYKQDAIESRKKYFSLLKAVLRNYGVEHEAEVFSGAFTRLHCRFRDRKDKRDIEKIVILSIKSLVKSMKDEFLEEFKSGEISMPDTSMLQKASAWYVVTYDEKNPNPRLLSFPWIVSEYLAEVKVLRCLEKPSLFSPIILKMEQQIHSQGSRFETREAFLDEQLVNYTVFCDLDKLKKALGVLLVWAQDEHIVAPPDSKNIVGLINRNTFIKLFLYVAEKSSYVSRENKPQNVNCSSASLCLEFLRFCLKLRFYNKQEIMDVIPFPVYRYTILSKRAVLAFHKFAVLGEFQTLCRGDIQRSADYMEMEPIYIDSKLFPTFPIDYRLIQNAQNYLREHSACDDVWLRKIRLTKKILVSAFGTERSLKNLRCILRKKPEKLSHFLTTGKGLQDIE